MHESFTDLHLKSASIQKEIEEHLGYGEGNLVFDFYEQKGDNPARLDLITINPRHNQSFLFRREEGYDKLDVLKKMLKYVRTYKEKENSYTIQWRIKGDRELHTSYFRASNMYDALDKLYYGRDMNTLTVFSCVLNPVA